jgi:prefoldin subunit 5
MVAPLTSQLQQSQPPETSVQSFQQLLTSLATYVSQVNTQVQQLQQGQSGSVDLSTMFQLQFRMQVMSQYIEAVSNTLSAVHQEMMSMARATKGQ